MRGAIRHLQDHLKGAKHRANLQSKNVNRPESVELNTQPGYLQHIDMLASNAHAKPHPLESDEASSSYQQDQGEQFKHGRKEGDFHPFQPCQAVGMTNQGIAK